jgi:hypothetical protein
VSPRDRASVCVANVRRRELLQAVMRQTAHTRRGCIGTANPTPFDWVPANVVLPSGLEFGIVPHSRHRENRGGTKTSSKNRGTFFANLARSTPHPAACELYSQFAAAKFIGVTLQRTPSIKTAVSKDTTFAYRQSTVQEHLSARTSLLGPLQVQPRKTSKPATSIHARWLRACDFNLPTG